MGGNSISRTQFSAPALGLGDAVLNGKMTRRHALRECRQNIRMFEHGNPEASENWKDIKAFYKEMFKGSKKEVMERLNADGEIIYVQDEDKTYKSFNLSDIDAMDLNDGKRDGSVHYKSLCLNKVKKDALQ